MRAGHVGDRAGAEVAVRQDLTLLPLREKVTERSEVARLAREGPPEEAVGLEPYGPPEAIGGRA